MSLKIEGCGEGDFLHRKKTTHFQLSLTNLNLILFKTLNLDLNASSSIKSTVICRNYKTINILLSRRFLY